MSSVRDRSLGRPLERRPKPFVWHKPAADIIAKFKRGRDGLDRHIKSATDD
jgi:hypothetical protein